MSERDEDISWEAAAELSHNLIAEFGDKEAMRVIAKLAGYRDVPPTIDEFIDDPYYAGNMLGDRLYPEWRQQARAVYPNPFFSPYYQLILGGALGQGKSSMSLLVQAMDMAKLTFVEDPQLTYQLLPSQEIVVAFFNATKDLAKRVLMEPFTDWLLSSQYFRHKMAELRFEHKRDKKYTKATQLFPNNLGMVCASRSGDVLGMACIGGIISELEYMDKVKSQAREVYRQIQRRMNTRFERGEGMLEPGHLVVDSSARYSEGFQAQLMLEARNDPNHRTLISEKAIWEVLGPAGKIKLSGRTFKLFVGDQHRDPMIIGLGGAYNIPDALVIDVPEEYRKFFEQDIFGAVRDLAGRSTASIHKFFSQVKLLLEAMTTSNPCDRDIVELDFDDPDDRLITHVDLSQLRTDMPYYIHVDIGVKQDRTGIALTRPSGDMVVNRVGRMLETSVVQDMVFRTDLVLCVAPRPGKSLPIAKLRNFIIDLVHNHIKVAGVSCDGYQSTQFLQEMKTYGLASELVSVDRTRDPYDQFKNIIIERRWSGPKHPVLENEFMNLIDFGKKIDHPDESENIDKSKRPSKDVSDAVVGSVFLCKEKNQLNAGMNSLGEYIKEMERMEKKLTVQDHIFDLGMKQKNKSRFFW